MSEIILKSVTPTEPTAKWISEFGDIPIKTYELSLDWNGNTRVFTFAIAERENPSNCYPEWGEDFDGFLKELRFGRSLKKCRKFINSVQDACSLAVHQAHGNGVGLIALPTRIEDGT